MKNTNKYSLNNKFTLGAPYTRELRYTWSSLDRATWTFTLTDINVRGPHVTPELNDELQCNVGNMWEKFTLYLYALKTA